MPRFQRVARGLWPLAVLGLASCTSSSPASPRETRGESSAAMTASTERRREIAASDTTSADAGDARRDAAPKRDATVHAIDAAPDALSADGSIDPPMALSTLMQEPAASVPTSALLAAVQSNNTFSLGLYDALVATASRRNLLTSPLSASLALTMAYAGAMGSTATEMATTLGFAGGTDTVFEGQDALIQALGSRAGAAYAADLALASPGEDASGPPPSDYQLEVVNAVWGESSFSWATPFLNVLAQDYGTGVFLEDFGGDPDDARTTINAWVFQQTAGNVQGLLPASSVSNQTRLVLVNAVHLELPWDVAFEASETHPAAFTTMNGTKTSTVTAEFMHQTATYPYVDDGSAQIVWLPLASSRQLAVIIALPEGDLATYEAGLTASSAALEPPSATALVELSLPRVTFAAPSFSLASALTTMGMTDAFDMAGANFAAMVGTDGGTNPGLYLGDVLQRASLSMEEEGLQASIATATVGSSASSASQGSSAAPIVMNVNRPYFVSVIDLPTGALLFMGHVVDPNASTE